MSLLPTNDDPKREAQDQLNELAELATSALAQAALDGLTDMAEGRLVEDGELDHALAVAPPQPRLKD